MRAALGRYRLLAVILLFNIVIFRLQPAAGREIFFNSVAFTKKMLVILPPIFILLNLLDVWLPRDLMARYLGGKNVAWHFAINGIGLYCGPHHGAFPIAATMLNKGATFMNAMVFLGSWSILKVSMVLYEISILGLKFGLTRLLINIPGLY